jgi:hypothetical protein
MFAARTKPSSFDTTFYNRRYDLFHFFLVLNFFLEREKTRKKCRLLRDFDTTRLRLIGRVPGNIIFIKRVGQNGDSSDRVSGHISWMTPVISLSLFTFPTVVSIDIPNSLFGFRIPLPGFRFISLDSASTS